MGPPEPCWLSDWSVLEIYRERRLLVFGIRFLLGTAWVSPEIPSEFWKTRGPYACTLWSGILGVSISHRLFKHFISEGFCEFPHCLVSNIKQNDVHGRHFGVELKCLGILDCFRVIVGSFSPLNLSSYNCRIEIMIAKIYKALPMCWATNMS